MIHKTLMEFARGEKPKREVFSVMLQAIRGHHDLKRGLWDILTNEHAQWGLADFNEHDLALLSNTQNESETMHPWAIDDINEHDLMLPPRQDVSGPGHLTCTDAVQYPVHPPMEGVYHDVSLGDLDYNMPLAGNRSSSAYDHRRHLVGEFSSVGPHAAYVPDARARPFSYLTDSTLR